MTLQVSLLEQSFSRILPQKEAFAEAFYARLFEQFPQVKPLFTYTDMKLQQNKLLGALAMELLHRDKISCILG